MNERLVCEPVGCEECFFTGYKGRKAVYEVITVDQNLVEEAQNHGTPSNTLKINNKISSIKDNAIQLFINKETSYQEIYPLIINDQ